MFAARRGQVKLAVHANPRGHCFLDQLLKAADADPFQHGGKIGGAGAQVTRSEGVAGFEVLGGVHGEWYLCGLGEGQVVGWAEVAA